MNKSKKKPPVIGELFSSDDSSDDTCAPSSLVSRRAQTSASESDRKQKVKLRVNMTSASDQSDSKSKRKPRSCDSIKPPPSNDSPAPDGYVAIDKKRLNTIKHNTLIQYEKLNGKMITTKYFKKCDRIAGSILVGFYQHNKKNYSEDLDNIKTIFIKGISGGSDPLKGTIEMPQNEWKTMRRDMIVSYEKNDGEYIYRAKFNSFLKGKDGASRMSFTTEQGYSYVANPDNIAKIFRHITSNDRTLQFILEAIQRLESRVKALEQKAKK